jgi:tripartite-type tricarboxylate transporter receptor subunit TctC
MLIIARPDMPGVNLKELIAWLKANPGKTSVASAGINSASHIASIFFQNETGTHLQHVPYRGGALAINDIIAGHVDLMLGPAAEFLQPVLDGAVKAYAVTTAHRLSAAPNIPTVDEADLPGLHMALWNGLWAPAGTSHAMVDRLNAAVVGALANPTVRARLASLGQDIPPRDEPTPESLGQLQRDEIGKWWPILKQMQTR